MARRCGLGGAPAGAGRHGGGCCALATETEREERNWAMGLYLPLPHLGEWRILVEAAERHLRHVRAPLQPRGHQLLVQPLLGQLQRSALPPMVSAAAGRRRRVAALLKLRKQSGCTRQGLEKEEWKRRPWKTSPEKTKRRRCVTPKIGAQPEVEDEGNKSFLPPSLSRIC